MSQPEEDYCFIKIFCNITIFEKKLCFLLFSISVKTTRLSLADYMYELFVANCRRKIFVLLYKLALSRTKFFSCFLFSVKILREWFLFYRIFCEINHFWDIWVSPMKNCVFHFSSISIITTGLSLAAYIPKLFCSKFSDKDFCFINFFVWSSIFEIHIVCMFSLVYWCIFCIKYIPTSQQQQNT